MVLRTFISPASSFKHHSYRHSCYFPIQNALKLSKHFIYVSYQRILPLHKQRLSSNKHTLSLIKHRPKEHEQQVALHNAIFCQMYLQNNSDTRCNVYVTDMVLQAPSEVSANRPALGSNLPPLTSQERPLPTTPKKS